MFQYVPYFSQEDFDEEIEKLKIHIHTLLLYAGKELYWNLIVRGNVEVEIFVFGKTIEGKWFDITKVISNRCTFKSQCGCIKAWFVHILPLVAQLLDPLFAFYGPHDHVNIVPHLATEWFDNIFY